MPLTVATIAERRASAEAKEGLTAFLEKRKPSLGTKESRGVKGIAAAAGVSEVRQGVLRVAAGRAAGRSGEVLLLRKLSSRTRPRSGHEPPAAPPAAAALDGGACRRAEARTDEPSSR